MKAKSFGHSREIGGRIIKHGQSMVEFAFAASILFLLIFGILEISRLVLTINTANNLSREGSHYAALHPETTVVSLTQQISPTMFLLDPANPNVVRIAITCPSCATPDAVDQPVTVTVNYTWTTGVNFPGLGGRIAGAASSTTRRER